jgi:hypothetical protein
MGRVNQIHTRRETGDDAVADRQGFPHGIGGADVVVFMPLQCATHWDGLGHIFDRGLAYNGRPANEVVTPAGDLVTGIERVAPTWSAAACCWTSAGPWAAGNCRTGSSARRITCKKPSSGKGPRPGAAT